MVDRQLTQPRLQLTDRRIDPPQHRAVMSHYRGYRPL